MVNVFNKGHTASVLEKSFKNLHFPTACSPQATSNIPEVSTAFFPHFSKNQMQIYCYFKSAILYRHSFIHSIGMCIMQRFFDVLRSLFHSSLLYTFSCHPSPPSILPSSLTHLAIYFLVYLSILLFPNSLLGILFSSILCTCPNQRNLFNLIVSIMVRFLTLA